MKTFPNTERMSCATCHAPEKAHVDGMVANLENIGNDLEVIGIQETAGNLRLDDDPGFYWQYEAEIQRGMFKNPTVRNSAVTAPYMHNGVYANLEEVMDFYNKGGGAGLGFDLPHQTLPFDELNLNTAEQEAIVVYLKTLTDTNVTKPDNNLL